MTLDEARALKQALDAAIAEAETAGRDSVDLARALSAELGASLADLEAAIAARKEI